MEDVSVVDAVTFPSAARGPFGVLADIELAIAIFHDALVDCGIRFI